MFSTAASAGSVPGSDFYIIGGITEVNYNIRSGGFDASAGQATSQTPLSTAFAAKAYVMNIAIDLRLVQTTTLEVVDVVSYQKQIIGREFSAGVFDFLNGNVFDISAGEGGLEPVSWPCAR
jgi:curli production assembly/transport component CsgG/holdfast attachment protein HfaB